MTDSDTNADEATHRDDDYQIHAFTLDSQTVFFDIENDEHWILSSMTVALTDAA